MADPLSFEALIDLATRLRSSGRFDEAISAAKQALAMRPRDAGGHNNLGLCYLAARRPLEALASFERASRATPRQSIVLHNRGLALQRLGRDKEAAQAYRAAIEADPNATPPYVQLAQLLASREDRQGAIECLRKAHEIDPNPGRSRMLLAQFLFEEGRYGEAEACAREEIAQNPESSLAHGFLGVLMQYFGRFDEAVASFEASLALQPRQVGPMFALSYSRRFTEADRPMMERMRSMLESDPLIAADQACLQYALGKAHDDLGEYEAAMRHYIQANDIERDRKKADGRLFDRPSHTARFDAFIRAFTAERAGSDSDSETDSDLPVLIVGMMRSGTTLTEQILSSHRDVGAGGELSYWPKRAGEALWQAVEQKLDPSQARAVGKGYLELLEGLAPGKRRVTDKLPSNFAYLGFIHRLLPKARFIHCRRSPVDTCLSNYVTPSRNTPEFIHDRSDLVFVYREYLRLMEHWRTILPADRFLEIDYEELIRDRERVTREMIKFCGLEWDESCLHPELNERVVSTPTLWQARQPVYSTSVERWRRYEPWLGPLKELLSLRHP